MLYDVGGGGEKSSWELVPFTYILQLFGADLYLIWAEAHSAVKFSKNVAL